MPNTQRRREQKAARRSRRKTTRPDTSWTGPPIPDDLFGTGWDVEPPGEDDPVWTVDHCPVAARCAGCGSADDLRINLSWFGPDEVACVTVCPVCEGTSMVQLVGLDGLPGRVEAHREHVPSG